MGGRIRTIKPEILDDEVASGLSDAAWRLWVSLWVLADDQGDVRAGEKYLAANVWQDTSRDAATPLAELIEKGRVHPYSVAGQRYLRIHAWAKHQRVDNAAKPRVPTPDEDDGTWNQELSGRFAANRGESPRTSASLGDSPLARRARAQSGGETPTPTPTPTPTTEPAAGAPPPTDTASKQSPKKGTRITPDWTPSPKAIAFAREQGVDALACVGEFVDYWLAEPGSKGIKLDWNATFRLRIRFLIEKGRAPMLPVANELPPETPVTPDPHGVAKVQAILAGVSEGKVVSMVERKGVPRGT